ncbi:MAG TPA: DUF2891 domain-containing protein [Thermoanaerobaculia bacterium]|nr:DUF2891 domain-containing protein [Thermoanaerobaculia bacterium]
MVRPHASLLLSVVLLVLTPAGSAAADLDREVAGRFAALALDCVHKEYPNKIAHVLRSDSDAKPPRELTPAFYGCYDWHSAVHGHWLLARLGRLDPSAPFSARAREALGRSLTEERIAAEVKYLEGEGRASFERPYGLAWLMQLGQELREWDDPDARRWSRTIEPLERATVSRVSAWLPKLSHPVRSGEHSQSAFALGLMLDAARASDYGPFAALVEGRIREFYLDDRDCPIEYEPSGEDFLSPCLAEADAVRRVLSPAEMAAWLGAFLPTIARDGSAEWLRPAVVTDVTDGKLVHLDGLNLSRAWMLDGIAASLPPDDPRIASLRAASAAHGASGLAAVSDAHYEGGHWLGSFATYYVTRRGVPLAAEVDTP